MNKLDINIGENLKKLGFKEKVGKIYSKKRTTFTHYNEITTDSFIKSDDIPLPKENEIFDWLIDNYDLSITVSNIRKLNIFETIVLFYEKENPIKVVIRDRNKIMSKKLAIHTVLKELLNGME